MLAKHYAAVSKSTYHTSSLQKRRNMKSRRLMVDRALQMSCREYKACRGKICKPFSATELDAALRQMGGKAPGPDGITTKMLQELGPRGKAALLEIANRSWRKKQVPTVWKRANIVAIPKPGKLPENPSSFRPISLTSCVGKTVERQVQCRLEYLLENTNKLVPEQAGFRAGRGTEKQITRLAQNVMDGLQQKKMQRTVLVSVDMRAAYDKVQKSSLLLKMVDMGVPPCILKWIRSFLSDRRARVKWNETLSQE